MGRLFVFRPAHLTLGAGQLVGSFAQRMVEAKGSPFKVILSTNQRESVQDADYVTTQLRVGHMEARRRDEYLGLRHGLIGQETTGAASDFPDRRESSGE